MNHKRVIRYCFAFAILATLLYWTTARAQERMMDALASKVIQKYQQSSCEQLAQKKNEPKSPQEQKVVEMLRNDPKARAAFLDKVAAPVANKLFECGLIP